MIREHVYPELEGALLNALKVIKAHPISTSLSNRSLMVLIKEMLIKEREKSALLEKKLNEIEKKLKKRNSTK